MPSPYYTHFHVRIVLDVRVGVQCEDAGSREGIRSVQRILIIDEWYILSEGRSH